MKKTPEAVALPVSDAQILIREYMRLTLTESVPRQGKDPDVARRLLDSLARNISQAVTFKTLRKDMYGTEENLDDFISERTVSGYTAMFENMFVIDPIKGWVPAGTGSKATPDQGASVFCRSFHCGRSVGHESCCSYRRLADFWVSV